MGQGEGDAQRQIGTAAEGGRARLRRPQGGGILLGEEALQPAERELVLDARVESREIIGRGPHHPGADVEWPHPAEPAPRPAAVAADDPHQPADVHRRPHLVAPAVVERLGQDEGAGVAVAADRLPAGEGARQHEPAAGEEAGPEPGGQGRGERQRGGESAVALDPHRDPQQEPALGIGQPPDRRRVGIDPEIAGAGQVAPQAQHPQRLPGESGGVAPQVVERERGAEERVVAPGHRHPEGGAVRLVPREPAGEPHPRGHQADVALLQRLAHLPAADEPGKRLHQPAEREPEALAAELEQISEVECVGVGPGLRQLALGTAPGERGLHGQRVHEAAGDPVLPLPAAPEGEGEVRGVGLRLPQSVERRAPQVGAGEQLGVHSGAGIVDRHRDREPERGGQEALQPEVAAELEDVGAAVARILVDLAELAVLPDIRGGEGPDV